MHRLLRPHARLAASRSGSTAAGSRCDRLAGQGGFGLIEVIVAVALIGTLILALAAGMLTIVRANAATAERQQAAIGLASFAESLKAAEYRRCNDPANPATASAYQAAYDSWPEAWTPPAGMTVEVLDVEYWHRPSSSFQAACPTNDNGSQRLTLKVTWRDREDRSQIVKRAR